MSNKLNESLRRLLDISPKDSTEDSPTAAATATAATKISEINETASLINKDRKKFTVIKNVDKRQSPTKCPTPTTTPIVDFKVGYEKQTSYDASPHIHPDDATDLLAKENEDVFLDDVMHSLTTAANNNRYQEGQDTITSLKNSVFVKQLAEMRRRASIKSSKSSHTLYSLQSSSFDGRPQLQIPITQPTQVQDVFVSGTVTPSSNMSKAGSRNSGLFFRSQDSIRSGKKVPLAKDAVKQTVGKSPSNTSAKDKRSVTATVRKERVKSISDSESKQLLPQAMSTGQQNLQASRVSTYQPEQLIDTITEAMSNNKNDEDYQNLMRQIKYILAQSERLDEKRRTYLKRTFKIIACFLLFFTFLMGLMVITSVIVQMNAIEQYQQNRTYNYRNISYLYQLNRNNTNKIIQFVDELLISPSKTS